MKTTVVAPANIALVKYWGKKDEKLRLPLNSSISMNLSRCLTTTTVEFSKKYKVDEILYLPNKVSVMLNSFQHLYRSRNKFGMTNDTSRIIHQLDRIRKLANITLRAKVVTKNNFPSSSGIASSASGFAALTVVACAAAGIHITQDNKTPRHSRESGNLYNNYSIDPRVKPEDDRKYNHEKEISEKALNILARVGSGSACRSIPDGYVIWEIGSESKDSYAHSLYPASYWDLRDIILIVSQTGKKVGSTAGMENVWSSPLMEQRLKDLPERIKKIKTALKNKDFKLLGETMEEECLNMHAVMQSQKPPLFYWTKETEKIMAEIKKWRREGLAVYFTIDAGPNVHVFCEGKSVKEVLEKVKKLDFVKKIIVNKPSAGARIIKKDLF